VHDGSMEVDDRPWCFLQCHPTEIIFHVVGVVSRDVFFFVNVVQV